MEALFQTLARLANGTFHVARPLRSANDHHKITQSAEGDRKGRAETLNRSSTNANNSCAIGKESGDSE